MVESLDVVVVPPRRDVEVARAVTPPQKPVEAMALGRPLIVSDLPALREVVSQQSSLFAMLVRPDDPDDLATAIAEAERDRADQRRSIGRLVSAARGRTWASLVARYSQVYAEAVEQMDGGEGDGH